jgi:H+/Cl- antiporter ClcA
MSHAHPCSFAATGTGAVVAALRIVFRLPQQLPNLEEIGLGHAHLSSLKFMQGTLVCAISVMGGASLGPEAGLAMAGAGIGSWLGKKLHLTKKDTTTATLSAISGGLGGLFSCPLLSAIFLLELSGTSIKQSIGSLLCLLLPATVSFAIFFPVIGTPFFETFTTPLYEFRSWQLGAGIFIGLLSMVIALVTAVVMVVVKTIFEALSAQVMKRAAAAAGGQTRAGAERSSDTTSSSSAGGRYPRWPPQQFLIKFIGQIMLTAAGGAVVGVFTVLLPLTSSSGSSGLTQLVKHYQELSTGVLVASLFTKMLVTAVSVHSGFVGGLVFPLLFIGGVTGTLIHRMIPVLPLGLCFACGMGAVPSALFPLPFSLIALVGFSVNIDSVQCSCVALAVLTAQVAFSGVALGLAALKGKVVQKRGLPAGEECKVQNGQAAAAVSSDGVGSA